MKKRIGVFGFIVAFAMGISCVFGQVQIGGEYGQAGVFPNPTDQQLHIDLGEFYSGVHIRLTNYLGQVIESRQYDLLRETQLELTGASGVYFLEIKTDKGVSASLKIVTR